MQSLVQQDAILSELMHLRNHVGGTQPWNSMSAPGSLFTLTLSGYLRGPKDDNEQQLSLLRAAMHANITALSKGNKKTLVNLSLSDDVRSELQQVFISRFHYKEREHRKSNIKSPYKETFKWIFRKGRLQMKTTFSQ